MFSKRPPNPMVGMALGIIFLAIAVLSFFAAFVWNEPTDVTGRGIPLWVIPPILLVSGLYFTIYGAVWVRRDRDDPDAYKLTEEERARDGR